MDLIITIPPVITKDLPISPRFTPYNFLSRCKFSTLTTRQPMVEFYLLTFPRFLLRKKDHKSYFGKNRTHDFRTSRCAAYLLDHSGDDIPAFNGGRGTSTPRNGRLSQQIRPELQLNSGSYLGPPSRPTLPQQEGQTRKGTLGSCPNRSDGSTGQPPHIPTHCRATRLEQTVPATHGR